MEQINAVEIITNKLVTLNYDTLTKLDYILKENDIFSIKKYGKYKYINIIKNTKSPNIDIVHTMFFLLIFKLLFFK